MFTCFTFHHLRTSYSLFQKLKLGPGEFYSGVPLENAILLRSGTRIEVYTTDTEPEGKILGFFSAHSGLGLEEMESFFSILKGKEAARHLFRLAAKVESRVLGETYLPLQVKAALEGASDYGMEDEVEKYFGGALKTYERASKETAIEGRHIGMAQSLLKGAEKVLLFGAGLSGIRLCSALQEEVELKVLHRDREVAEIAARESGGRPVGYSQIKGTLKEAGVLVCATLASHYRVTPDLVEDARPLKILDLSPFGNVSPQVAEMEGVSLLDGEVKRAVEENYRLMEGEVPRVEDIVEEELKKLDEA